LKVGDLDLEVEFIKIFAQANKKTKGTVFEVLILVITKTTPGCIATV
jgi:hypothetical protein